jgi:hypothetical protein
VGACLREACDTSLRVESFLEYMFYSTAVDLLRNDIFVPTHLSGIRAKV